MEKVSELSKIMAFGIFTTPALVMDGEVKVVGQVPSVDQIKKIIG
ncbi:MAG: thioredoxin family protein [Desulfobaccales bacterium]